MGVEVCFDPCRHPIPGLLGAPQLMSGFVPGFGERLADSQTSYSGDDIVANVALDLFLSSTSDGSPEYEIMIWVGAIGGAGPISSTGSPIATPTVNGVTWDLYYGLNSQMKVYSFVAPTQQTAFSADLVDFVDNLVSAQGMPTSQYFQTIGAGTEPFQGSNAVFTTTKFSVTVPA